MTAEMLNFPGKQKAISPAANEAKAHREALKVLVIIASELDHAALSLVCDLAIRLHWKGRPR